MNRLVITWLYLVGKHKFFERILWIPQLLFKTAAEACFYCYDWRMESLFLSTFVSMLRLDMST